MVTAEVACVILEGYSVCIMKKMCAQHMNSTHPFKLTILPPTATLYYATPAHCAGRLVGDQFAHSPPLWARRCSRGSACQVQTTVDRGPLPEGKIPAMLWVHLCCGSAPRLPTSMLPRLFSIHGVRVEGTDQIWPRGKAVMGLAVWGREKLALDERESGTPLKKPGAAPFEVSSWWRRRA
jgi:hypothetical protein